MDMGGPQRVTFRRVLGPKNCFLHLLKHMSQKNCAKFVYSIIEIEF